LERKKRKRKPPFFERKALRLQMQEITLENCDFGDLRLSNRFLKILTQLSSSIGSSIPSCGVVWGQTKAIYRFLSNPNVTTHHILNAEQERMLANVVQKGSKRLYHLQDTTVLD
jgi:Transposase DNA-binding